MKRYLVVGLLLLAACAEEHAPEQLGGVELKPIDSFDSPLWTGELAEDDPVVARVEGTPITLSMLRKQVERAGEGADPRQILDRMIELELLARQAFEAGRYTFDVVGQPLRETLARRWIEDKFEEELSPQDIPDDVIKKVYDEMQARWDHYERFHITDVQLLCCETDGYENCFRDLFDTPADRTAHVEACLEHHRAEVDEIHQRLARAESKEEFKDIYEREIGTGYPTPDLKATYGTRARIQDYDFQYDVDRTYEKQFEKIRYRVFHKAVMEGAKDAWIANGRKAPFITPVLQSPLGYHILYVNKVDPEQHWGPEHPQVQAEIRENIYTPWRRKHFQETMEKLCAQQGCELHHSRLGVLQEAQQDG